MLEDWESGFGYLDLGMILRIGDLDSGLGIGDWDWGLGLVC